MRLEEYSPNWRSCTSKELPRLVQLRFCRERWVSRMRLSPGWKRPTRSTILNLHTSKRGADSSPCVKIRDSDNLCTVSAYPIKAERVFNHARRGYGEVDGQQATSSIVQISPEIRINCDTVAHPGLW